MSKLKLSWTAREYMGPAIWKYIQGQIFDPQIMPLIIKNNLSPGDQVIVPNLFDYDLMTVFRDEWGELGIENETHACVLDFEEDRNCWISLGLINKKALERLRINI